MQGIFGRILYRAFASNVQTEIKTTQQPRDPLRFVTGCSGFSKSWAQCPGSNCSGIKRWTFGDDSYFIARDKTADVLGKLAVV